MVYIPLVITLEAQSVMCWLALDGQILASERGGLGSTPADGIFSAWDDDTTQEFEDGEDFDHVDINEDTTATRPPVDIEGEEDEVAEITDDVVERVTVVQKQAIRANFMVVNGYKKNDGKARQHIFLPSIGSFSKACSKGKHQLLQTMVWMPHKQCSDIPNFPTQPPCPLCGLTADGQLASDVISKGPSKSRSYAGFGIDDSGFLVGSIHHCKDCRDRRKQQKEAGDPNWKSRSYVFNSFNLRSMRHYTNTWGFVLPSFPLRLGKKSAIKTKLAEFLQSACNSTGGSNPHSLAVLLREVFDHQGDTKRLQFLLHQLCVSHVNLPTGQQTIQAALGQSRSLLDQWEDPQVDVWPVDCTSQEFGSHWSPGSKSIRKMVQDLNANDQETQMRFREQTTGGQQLSADHSCKAFKLQLHKNRSETRNISILCLIV